MYGNFGGERKPLNLHKLTGEVKDKMRELGWAMMPLPIIRKQWIHWSSTGELKFHSH